MDGQNRSTLPPPLSFAPESFGGLPRFPFGGGGVDLPAFQRCQSARFGYLRGSGAVAPSVCSAPAVRPLSRVDFGSLRLVHLALLPKPCEDIVLRPCPQQRCHPEHYPTP